MSSPAKGFALYLTLKSFLEVGGRLPFGLTKAIGPLISGAALRLMPRERRRIRTHLEMAFPELNDRQRDAIMHGCSRHFGLMARRGRPVVAIRRGAGRGNVRDRRA